MGKHIGLFARKNTRGPYITLIDTATLIDRNFNTTKRMLTRHGLPFRLRTWYGISQGHGKVIRRWYEVPISAVEILMNLTLEEEWNRARKKHKWRNQPPPSRWVRTQIRLPDV